MNSAVNPEMLVQLALRDLQNDELAAAEAKCLRALDGNRDHVRGWSVLGMVLQARGRHEDAIRVFNSLTLKQPETADHWINLGVAFRGARRYDAALLAYQRALPLTPPSAQLLYNIGLVHVELLDYESAYAVLSQAAAMAPADAWIHCTFAQCCYDFGNFAEALRALAGWTRFDGLTPANVAEMSYLLFVMGDARSAGEGLDWLAVNPPAGGRAALTLANIFERTNRLAEAHAAMARLKSGKGFDGSDPDVLLAEAVLAQRDNRHAEACRLLRAALDRQTDFVRRHNLLFPLAASLDAAADYDGAFEALMEAHRSQVAYLAKALGKTPADGSPTLALTKQGVERQDRLSWDDGDGPPRTDSPVFVVGFPRSGTTLLEQTLDAHPALVSMDEQPFLRRILEQVQSMGLKYPGELGKLSPVQLQGLRLQYWNEVAAKVKLAPGQRLVDKNPLNMLRLPLIRRLFPAASTVLVVRHPCDVLLSCFAQHFRAPDLAMLCRDLPALAQGYCHAFDYWYRQLPLLDAMTYELQYETFVTDFPSQVRRLADFLQLPWNESMLAPADNARAKGFISTPSYTQVVEPVSRNSMGRWKRYKTHFKGLMPVLEAQLQRWHYSP